MLLSDNVEPINSIDNLSWLYEDGLRIKTTIEETLKSRSFHRSFDMYLFGNPDGTYKPYKMDGATSGLSCSELYQSWRDRVIEAIRNDKSMPKIALLKFVSTPEKLIDKDRFKYASRDQQIDEVVSALSKALEALMKIIEDLPATSVTKTKKAQSPPSSKGVEMEYDLAFSFAGEHRQYVEQTVAACKGLGLRVFYDKDKNNEWWGKNFISEQRKIYGSKTRYFVPFISPEYFVKPIPSDEFESALMTAVERGDEYILPVIIGHPDIPAGKLHGHTHYLRAEDYSPDELAAEMRQRIKGGDARPAKDIAVVVNEAAALQMPKATPRKFSKYQEVEATIRYLGRAFDAAIRRLENETDFVGTVRQKDDAVTVRIEHVGKTVYTLNIFQGAMGDDASIGFNFDGGSLQRNSFHATATPYFDKNAQQAKLEILNLSLIDGNANEKLTKEELFSEIWKKLVKQIESKVP